MASETASWQFDRTGGRLCLDFVNTVGGMRGVRPNEHLARYADLLEFARQTGALPEAQVKRLAAEARRRPDAAARAFDGALALREALYRAFLARARGAAPDAADLAVIEADLRSALSHRRLVAGEGGAFAWAWDAAAELEAPLWPVLASAADVLTSPEALDRVRVCGMYDEAECSWLFVDETRAHTRRWCSMKDCGNRAKARRHWAKTRGGAAE